MKSICPIRSFILSKIKEDKKNYTCGFKKWCNRKDRKFCEFYKKEKKKEK